MIVKNDDIVSPSFRRKIRSYCGLESVLELAVLLYRSKPLKSGSGN